LIPFTFSTTQTYILEFGDAYMRVIKDGAYVLESNKTVSGAASNVITATAHGFSNADWVYISGVGGITGLNGRTGVVVSSTTNTFQLEDVFGTPITFTGTYTSGGTVARYYTLDTPWTENDLPTIKYTQSADVLTVCHIDYPPYDLSRTGHAAWTLTELDFASDIAPPATVSATAGTAGSTVIAYVVTAVNDKGQESVASAVASASSVNITTTAGAMTVNWSTVAGAAYYNIYRAHIVNASAVPPGAEYGYVGSAFGLAFTDGNITADFTKTPPLHYNPFAPGALKAITITNGGTGYAAGTTATITDSGTGSGALVVPIVVGGVISAFIYKSGGKDYTLGTIGIALGSTGGGAGATFTYELEPETGLFPGTVAYFQQRKYFAASRNRPETIWATKPGAFKNMDKAQPVVDSDSLELTLNSQRVNNIRHMVSMPGGLVLLTGDGAWQLSGGGQANSAVTPTNALAQPQSYNGCSDVPPIVSNYDILYVQAKGSIVRDLAYNFFVNIYTGTDLTVISNHLFTQHTLREWAYSEEPHKIVWAVRDDGVLLSMTFLKEQEVFGWAWHDTDGKFLSVASVTEGDEDAVYYVVRRRINSQWINCVERLKSRQLIDTNTRSAGANTGVETSWFVDCGLQSDHEYPAAGATLSGTSGTVTLEADTAIFSAGDIGKVMRFGNAIGTVTAYVNSTHLTVRLDYPVDEALPYSGVPLPQEEGEWSLTTPFSTIGGLWHLEGKTVKVLGDGNVFPDATVVNGSITLSRSVTKAIVGLGYVSQLQTLDLDIEAGAETVQGKRKKISALTVKVQNTRGLKAGPDFDHLTEFKQRRASVHMGQPIPLDSGIQRIIMSPTWTAEGRICIQQDYPLPMTILAVIPELSVGDRS